MIALRIRAAASIQKKNTDIHHAHFAKDDTAMSDNSRERNEEFEFFHKIDACLSRRADKQNARKKIERSYQRAMDIRDSTPIGDFKAAEENEMRYMNQYLRACRAGDATHFPSLTRRYLKNLRKERP
jgi:hypothetical protein